MRRSVQVAQEIHGTTTLRSREPDRARNVCHTLSPSTPVPGLRVLAAWIPEPRREAHHGTRETRSRTSMQNQPARDALRSCRADSAPLRRPWGKTGAGEECRRRWGRLLRDWCDDTWRLRPEPADSLFPTSKRSAAAPLREGSFAAAHHATRFEIPARRARSIHAGRQEVRRDRAAPEDP